MRDLTKTIFVLTFLRQTNRPISHCENQSVDMRIALVFFTDLPDI